MEFKVIEKFKRLLRNFTQKVGSIVFTYRMPNTFTLFETQYSNILINLENEKQRPRAKNSNSKVWDSIADKTICIDYTVTKGLSEVMKVHLTKSIDLKIH